MTSSLSLNLSMSSTILHYETIIYRNNHNLMNQIWLVVILKKLKHKNSHQCQHYQQKTEKLTHTKFDKCALLYLIKHENIFLRNDAKSHHQAKALVIHWHMKMYQHPEIDKNVIALSPAQFQTLHLNFPLSPAKFDFTYWD